jgi:hypothetical protein
MLPKATPEKPDEVEALKRFDPFLYHRVVLSTILPKTTNAIPASFYI